MEKFLIEIFGDYTLYALMGAFGLAMFIVGWPANDLWRDFRKPTGGMLPPSEIKKAMKEGDR